MNARAKWAGLVKHARAPVLFILTVKIVKTVASARTMLSARLSMVVAFVLPVIEVFIAMNCAHLTHLVKIVLSIVFALTGVSALQRMVTANAP